MATSLDELNRKMEILMQTNELLMQAFIPKETPKKENQTHQDKVAFFNRYITNKTLKNKK